MIKEIERGLNGTVRAVVEGESHIVAREAHNVLLEMSIDKEYSVRILIEELKEDLENG